MKRPRLWRNSLFLVYVVQTVLNVNVPDLPLNELKGFEITRLGTRHRAEPTIKSEDPRGHIIYWVGPPGLQQDAGIGTDFYAISMNKVSITPLQLDLTHYKSFGDLSTCLDGLIL
jgi:5'-nucleotidase